MKLYFSPGTSSLAPHIVLCEAGIPVELARVDLKTGKLSDGSDYTILNAKGYVPMLELDDGNRLTESAAIMLYVADHRPGSQLAPRPETLERYRMLEWLSFIGCELHKAYGTLFNPTAPADWKKPTMARLESRLDWLQSQMTQRDYLMGAQFSIADAHLFTVLRWSRFVKLDLARWPALLAFHDRIAARPAVEQAMRAEGLLK